MERFLEIRQTAVDPVVVDGQKEIVTEAQAIIIRWPNGGMVWNRPLGVRITEPSGQTTRIPIVDVTRLLQVACYGVAAAVMGLSLLAGRRNRQSSDEDE